MIAPHPSSSCSLQVNACRIPVFPGHFPGQSLLRGLQTFNMSVSLHLWPPLYPPSICLCMRVCVSSVLLVSRPLVHIVQSDLRTPVTHIKSLLCSFAWQAECCANPGLALGFHHHCTLRWGCCINPSAGNQCAALTRSYRVFLADTAFTCCVLHSLPFFFSS